MMDDRSREIMQEVAKQISKESGSPVEIVGFGVESTPDGPLTSSVNMKFVDGEQVEPDEASGDELEPEREYFDLSAFQSFIECCKELIIRPELSGPLEYYILLKKIMAISEYFSFKIGVMDVRDMPDKSDTETRRFIGRYIAEATLICRLISLYQAVKPKGSGIFMEHLEIRLRFVIEQLSDIHDYQSQNSVN